MRFEASEHGEGSRDLWGAARRRFFVILAIATSVLLIVLFIAPWVGPTRISVSEALTNWESLDATIFFRTRLPRTLLACITGGVLAMAGVVFQAILRNPLASPFTLGVSGGASLGAVSAVALGWEFSIAGVSLLPAASFAGAAAVIFLVYGLSRFQRGLSTLALLLAGVVLNYVCAALILLIYYFTDFTKSFLMMRWMMGSLEVYDYAVFPSLAPFVVLGVVLSLIEGPHLNALSAGEQWAASKGVEVQRLITRQYFAVSLAAGSVIAFSGPIGFVGLIVPHTLRIVIGADHRILLPASFLVGGAFLVICDTMARTIVAPTELPVGVLTSALGGPFFLWLLLRSHGVRSLRGFTD